MMLCLMQEFTQLVLLVQNHVEEINNTFLCSANTVLK